MDLSTIGVKYQNFQKPTSVLINNYVFVRISCRTFLAITPCTTFVLSKQSMQFTRKVPFYHCSTSIRQLSPFFMVISKYPHFLISFSMSLISLDRFPHCIFLHSAWKSNQTYLSLGFCQGGYLWQIGEITLRLLTRVSNFCPRGSYSFFLSIKFTRTLYPYSLTCLSKCFLQIWDCSLSVPQTLTVGTHFMLGFCYHRKGIEPRVCTKEKIFIQVSPSITSIYSYSAKFTTFPFLRIKLK